MTTPQHNLSNVHSFIYSLVPTDVGIEQLDEYTVLFEGFHEICMMDVEDRMRLPNSDPRHVNSIDDVFEEVWEEFKTKATGTLVEEEVYWHDDGPIVYSIFYNPTQYISENTLRLVGLSNEDIHTLLTTGMILENKQYRNIDSVLNETVIYENFMKSISQFLQSRYDETIDDISTRVRNTKDAGVLIKEIMADADLLDRVLIQLNKQLRTMLKTLNAKIVELRRAAQAAGNSSATATSIQQFYNLINSLVSRSIRVRGWQGFLISLGTHTILKFTLIQLSELKTIAAQLNFFSSAQSKPLTDKVEDISRISINISATTMMNYMGMFTEIIGVVNVMLDTLSNIRRKLQLNPRVVLATDPMNESMLSTEYHFWKSITENEKEPTKKPAGSGERMLLSAILTLHNFVMKDQSKDVMNAAFDVVRYFALPINARNLAEKYRDLIKNGKVQLGNLVKIGNQWALVSKIDPDRIIAIYPKEGEQPSEEWIEKSMTAATKSTVTVPLKELKAVNKEYMQFASELEEIHDIPVDKTARTEWIKDYVYWTTVIKDKNAKNMGEFMTYQVYWIPYPYKIEVVALDHEASEAAVMMSLRKLNQDFYQVDKVATNNTYSGRGLAHKLYRKIILDGINLMSDTEQSPGGKRIWLELAKMPDVTIYGIDYNQNPPVYTDVRITNEKIYGDYDLYTSHIIEKLKAKKEKLKDEIALLRSDIDQAINSDEPIRVIQSMESQLDKLESELDKVEYYNPESSRDYMRKIRLAAIKGSSSLPYRKSRAQLTEVEFLSDYSKNQDRSLNPYDRVQYLIRARGVKKIGTIRGLSIYLEPYGSRAHRQQTVYILDDRIKKTAGELDLYVSDDYQIAIPDYRITGEIKMATEYQGKGIPVLVYTLLIKKQGMTLMSGGLQSKGGMSIWKKLSDVPGIFVYAVDMNDQENPKLSQIDTDDFFIHGDFDIYDQSADDIRRNQSDDIDEMIELIEKDIKEEELKDTPDESKIAQWQAKIETLEKERMKMIYRNVSRVRSWMGIRLMAIAENQGKQS